MSAFVVSCRRLGPKGEVGPTLPVEGPFSSKAEAETYAVRMNRKPFTPFYFFVERVA